MKKIFITLALSLFFAGGAFAQQNVGFQSNNYQCRETSGTNQTVCWQSMRYQPGAKMEYPMDGNYWHKMQNVTRPLAVFVSNEVTGVQNTQYLGLRGGHHLYKETLCLNGSCRKPMHVLLDDNNNLVWSSVAD